MAEAIAACAEAGIHTILVTGDHPLTARAVAREIGLGGSEPRVLAGADLDAFLAAPGGDARTLDVIARAAPAQKLALVRALQQRGEIVAVTGDGVNDVPALQAADVGIAMGERATRSAREVSAIVLLDDDFGSIVKTIRLGRRIYDNLRKAIEYIIAVHIPIAGLALLPLLLGMPLMLTPIHIAFLEMIIDKCERKLRSSCGSCCGPQ